MLSLSSHCRYRIGYVYLCVHMDPVVIYIHLGSASLQEVYYLDLSAPIESGHQYPIHTVPGAVSSHQIDRQGVC